MSALPSSLHSATLLLICSLTSDFISPVSPTIVQKHEVFFGEMLLEVYHIVWIYPSNQIEEDN